MRSIKGSGGTRGERAAAFGGGAHGHEHAFHVWMVNDRCRRSHRAVHGAALHAVFGVLNGLLVSALRNRNALNAHAIARSIHHDEHVFEATVFFANEVANGSAVVAILQNSRGRGFDAHFVFDADAMCVVATAKRTIFVHHEFRHDKQRNPLHAFWRTLHASQHEMNDVLGHVVFAIGDEDFGAENLVRAIRQRLSAGAHEGQIRARLRLSEVHRAAPFAADEVFKVNGLELV